MNSAVNDDGTARSDAVCRETKLPSVDDKDRLQRLQVQLEEAGVELQRASEQDDAEGVKEAKRQLAELQSELSIEAGQGPVWLDSSTGPPVPFEPPRFDIRTQQKEFLAYLDEHGYAVSAGVVPDDDTLKHLRGKMWDFLEAYPEGTPVRHSDPQTWNYHKWLPDSSNGIIFGYGFGHSDFMWELRLQPKVKETFEAIWDTANLLVSFDGGNVFRPWKRNFEWLTDSGWWHVDQNAARGPIRQGKVHVASCFRPLCSLVR